MTPFYDSTKSYDDNYQNGPFGDFATAPTDTFPKTISTNFLGFPLNIPFGIPAGPLLNSKFVTSAWKWGFSLNTYKTVRGNEYPCHPFPNVIKVDAKGDVKPGDTLIGDNNVNSIDVTRHAITNSFGVPSRSPQIWQEDVRAGLKEMKPGNFMILSFMGTKKEGMTFEQYVEDFARTAKLAKDTGAPVLEVNFSCPNVGKEGLICNDIETSRAILEAVRPVRGNTPLLVKIGYFKKDDSIPEQLLEIIYQHANGVAAINTIQAKVTDKDGKQILPGSPVRLMSGICGAAIRWAGLEMAERIMEVKKRKDWKDFVVIGVGGVTTNKNFKRYMNLGVNAVQSATGAMWNPRLALDIMRAQYA